MTEYDIDGLLAPIVLSVTSESAWRVSQYCGVYQNREAG